MSTNSDTLTIGYDTRFLISDPRRRPAIAWATSKIEDTQPIGLTKLKFTQEPFNPTADNEELMIADFYKNSVEPTTPDSQIEFKQTSTITYSGTKPNIKVGGGFKTFTPIFHDDAVTVSKWTISDENGDIGEDTNYVIEYVGNKLKLKIVQNYELVGKVLIIQCIGTDGSAAEIKMEVIG